MTLSGTNNYSGGTVVSAGRLVGTTSSLQGAITNNAAVTIDQASNGTDGFANDVNGTFTVAQGNPATFGNVNQIYIVYAAALEPSTWAMGLAGLACGGCAMRRRRDSALETAGGRYAAKPIAWRSRPCRP